MGRRRKEDDARPQQPSRETRDTMGVHTLCVRTIKTRESGARPLECACIITTARSGPRA